MKGRYCMFVYESLCSDDGYGSGVAFLDDRGRLVSVFRSIDEVDVWDFVEREAARLEALPAGTELPAIDDAEALAAFAVMDRVLSDQRSARH